MDKSKGHAKCWNPEHHEDIIDHNVALLIAAKTAMAANCEPCVDRALPELKAAGVTESDVRWAIENGRASGIDSKQSACMLEFLCEGIQDGSWSDDTSVAPGRQEN